MKRAKAPCGGGPARPRPVDANPRRVALCDCGLWRRHHPATPERPPSPKGLARRLGRHHHLRALRVAVHAERSGNTILIADRVVQ